MSAMLLVNSIGSLKPYFTGDKPKIGHNFRGPLLRMDVQTSFRFYSHVVKGTMRKKEKADHRYTKYKELFYIHFIGTLAATRGCFILSFLLGKWIIYLTLTGI